MPNRLPNDAKSNTLQATASRHLIVALGASAGGAEAFGKFFREMPTDSGMSFVVIQHLDPNHPSILGELIGRSTSMPVTDAADGAAVLPNQVHVIPPNKSMTIKAGLLQLDPRTGTVPHVPIDRFFESLADDCCEYAACVVMTGAGTDGTVGLRAIKQNGGLAIAQSPETAQFDSMSRSAISTGLVDHILNVEQIPECLQRYVAFLQSQTGDESAADREQDLEALAQIHSLMRRRVGHDFSHYKEATILRRIRRRMQVHQCATMGDYVNALRDTPKECESLLNDLLIGVTSFFRDPEAFDVLAERVIPKLLADSQEENVIRVWVPACSTGEEAYSIAILFREIMDKLESPPTIQIFATDISEPMLSKARLGRYAEGIAAHISPDRLKKYFVPHGDIYQVSKPIREMCIFSSHSLLKHPPFSRLDLISCRNMLIYMNSSLQNKVMSLFHYALKPGGFLFLGAAETTTAQDDLFRAVDKRHRLFARRESIGRPVISLPLLEPARSTFSAVDAIAGPPPKQPAIQRLVDRLMIDHYSSPCIVINQQQEVIYVSGRTGKYLEITTGMPSRNVMDLIRKRLRIELRAGLHRSITAGETVVYENLAVPIGGLQQRFNLIVRPATEFGPDLALTLIIFQELGPPAAPDSKTSEPPHRQDETINLHLENELRLARERLQSTVEEYETTNEELKSSNEELQSMNEELQSSNEALQSSKEELQSINEELETVNNELLYKIHELDRANSDLQNVFENTNVATIFLDPESRIKSYTPAARELFRLIGSDIGRSIADIQTNFRDGELIEDIKEVLRTHEPKKDLVRKPNGDRWYYLSIRPYHSTNGGVDGTVINIVDVTELKNTQEDLVISEQNLRLALKSAGAGIWSVEVKTGRCEWSAEFLDLYGLPPSMGNSHYTQWVESTIPDDRAKLADGYVQTTRQRLTDFHIEYRINHPVTGTRWILTTGRVNYDQANNASKISGISVDVTSRVRAEEDRAAQDKLREAQKIESMNVLAGGIAHDFNNLLLGILGNTSLLEQQVQDESQGELVQEIEEASRRASELCLQMLAYSGKGKFVVRSQDINALAMQVREQIRSVIAPGIKLEATFEDNLPSIEADATQIRQVMTNLLTNAAESIESHQGTISLSTGLVTLGKEQISACVFNADIRDGEYVYVRIEDSGHGMDERIIERIFEPFFTTKFTGRGLGLPAVMGIVRSHHGCIHVDTKLGRGTVFTVYLPASAERSPKPGNIKIVPARRWVKTGTVLVVDDSDTARRTMQRMLQKEGFQVLLADDGIKAIEVLQENLATIEIVLLDLTMPRQDGIETFRQIKVIKPDLPVVLSSGYNQSEVGCLVSDLGFAGFLQKPYRQSELTDMVHALIEDGPNSA